MPESGNILVGIKVKKTVKVDVKGPITNYIKRVYGDHMAQEASDSLEVLQELRNQIMGACMCCALTVVSRPSIVNEAV